MAQPTIIEGKLAKPPQAVTNIRAAAKKPPRAPKNSAPPSPPPVPDWDDSTFCDRATLGDGQRMVVIRVKDGQVHWRSFHGTAAESAVDLLTAGTTLAAQVCAAHTALEERWNAMIRAAMGNQG